MLKSKWLSLVLDVDFMTLTILKLDFLEKIKITWSHNLLEGIITIFLENHQFSVILSYFK